MAQRPQHPSGKPIRKPVWGVKSIWRIPDRGSVIPRLQMPATANAIGFTARICSEDDDD